MKPRWIEIAKLRMRELGIYQSDLANVFGVETRSAVGHYFAGRRKLSLDQAVELANTLDLSMDYLFAGKKAYSKNTDFDFTELEETLTSLPPKVTQKILKTIGDIASWPPEISENLFKDRDKI